MESGMIIQHQDARQHRLQGGVLPIEMEFTVQDAILQPVEEQKGFSHQDAPLLQQ